MKKALSLVVVCLSAATASAQQPPPPSVDLAGFVKQQHQTVRRYLTGSADKMPEGDFGFKPAGTSADVRTFGQIIAHLAASNYLFCAQAKGEQPPATVSDKETTLPKAALVKALNDALTYCDGVYDTQTIATLSEMMKRQGPNNTTLERARGNALMLNIAHNFEHYGNLVTYMRAKGLVPPSSER